jgi:HAD superfamily, subfamily IIIB (Acid phosphatase)
MLVIVDIDGTIANGERRFKKAGPEPKGRGPKYWAWLKKVQTRQSILADKPVQGMKPLIASLLACGHNLVYLTGREEKYSDVTIEWLNKYKFPTFPDLYMRPTGDNRCNSDYKESVIQQLIEPWQETLVIDDDYTGEIAKLCKKRGWTFLKAMSGGQL